MTSQRVVTPRTILVMILLACVIVFIGTRLQHGGGAKPTPNASTDRPAPVSVIDELCTQVAAKVKNAGNPGKYTSLCAQARQARNNDQPEACATKLKRLDSLLNDAQLASIPDTTISRACKPKRIEA